MLRFIPGIFLHRSIYPCSLYSHPFQLQRRYYRHLNFTVSKQNRAFHFKNMVSMVSLMGHQLRVGLSTRSQSINLRLNMPIARVKWNMRHVPSGKIGGMLFLSFAVSEPAYAETPDEKSKGSSPKCVESSLTSSHGKIVYTDYTVIGIPGDGRCLFRSVAHGACMRSGQPLPDEVLQRQLADELREKVADEFIKRRSETEWFVEGDFDTYVSHIRKPHVWGGEPELFMASHVLKMPITVYMHDEDAGGLIAIAEYGQEYGKDDPIRVLYHGFGHYDALRLYATKAPQSRL
ncbi:hypothetical protein LUZ63_002289 [Rhynchospora breviuscula]|uniref:Ubiquitin thioesterase OTU n=1 Tax=Rhynchospora breviuscula TaxID=2022672 RepID=A0A9Q0HYD7_9POAL|nr:hypothetical protein LUZ63_002289 [Rhynchospora breviuscula]